MSHPMHTGDRSESCCGGVNILIVDDNPESLLALEAILSGLDRKVIRAMSGEEALKYLLQEDVDLILLDVKMPGMDGYETAARIREREKMRDVPIIFLTAYNTGETDVVKGYSYGAVDFIFKPVVPEILRSKINVFVELAKKTEALRQKNEELERAERELLRTKVAESLIKYAPDSVFLSDLDGKILQANDAACALLGLGGDELVEQSLCRFLTCQEGEQLTAVLREVAGRGVPRTLYLHPRSSSGKITPTALNVSALRNPDGKIVGAIGILHDMSAYERVLQELEQSRTELQERIQELEQFEEVVVGRELKMIALEKEIERLRAELNKAS